MKPDELDMLIGRMFVVGFHGLHVTRQFAEWYSRNPAGGIVLFRRNLRDARQVVELTRGLTRLGEQVRPGFRLLIAVDQENGSLSPLRGIVASLPGNMGLAATGDPAAAYSAGYITGSELQGLGIHLNLAPVLDLASQANPVVGTRAFSDDPAVVAEFGVAMAKGLRDAGVLFAAKHFPGHGSCVEDSHLEPPHCGLSLERLWSEDLLPFRSVSGLGECAFMFSHVRYECLDPERPASLSPPVHEFVRGEMGFEGVLLTDCLEMGAVQRITPYPADAVSAVNAGNDLLLISHSAGHQEAAFRAVKEAAASGEIPLRRIEESVLRVERWKERIHARTTPIIGYIPSPEDLAGRVVTMSGHNLGWPREKTPIALITPEMGRLTPAEDSENADVLEQSLKAHGVSCRRIVTSRDPGEDEVGQKLAEVGKERVAFVLSDPGRCPGQVEMIRRLSIRNPVLLISTRDPHEADVVDGNLPIAFTYSTESTVLQALARVLAGETSPVGRIPVRGISGRRDRIHGDARG